MSASCCPSLRVLGKCVRMSASSGMPARRSISNPSSAETMPAGAIPTPVLSGKARAEAMQRPIGIHFHPA